MTGRFVAREKSRAFALRVVKLCRLLQERDRALIREAEQAESRADFIHKLSIALKEASETGYWLDLLTESGYLDSVHGQSMMTDTEELLKILTAIIRTTKRRR